MVSGVVVVMVVSTVPVFVCAFVLVVVIGGMVAVAVDVGVVSALPVVRVVVAACAVVNVVGDESTNKTRYFYFSTAFSCIFIIMTTSKIRK